jgi:hypothetical protein
MATDEIVYLNFFQALSEAYQKGLYSTPYSGFFVHALRDFTHVSVSLLLDQMVVSYLSTNKKMTLATLEKIRNDSRSSSELDLTLFGMLVAFFITPMITCFLSVAFLSILTEMLYHCGPSNEVKRVIICVLFYFEWRV